MAKRKIITEYEEAKLRSYLLDNFKYDADTGWLTRTRTVNPRAKEGDRVGAGQKRGTYLQFQVFGEQHMLHRAIWLMEKRSMPKGDIDHVNGIKDDNRIANLRDVSKKENSQNLLKAKRNSKTGYLGVVKDHRSHRFYAYIRCPKLNKTINLGSFLSPEDAHAAYIAAKREMHPGATL